MHRRTAVRAGSADRRKPAAVIQEAGIRAD